jgi:hypothetical protein
MTDVYFYQNSEENTGHVKPKNVRIKNLIPKK